MQARVLVRVRKRARARARAGEVETETQKELEMEIGSTASTARFRRLRHRTPEHSRVLASSSCHNHARGSRWASLGKGRASRERQKCVPVDAFPTRKHAQPT